MGDEDREADRRCVESANRDTKAKPKHIRRGRGASGTMVDRASALGAGTKGSRGPIEEGTKRKRLVARRCRLVAHTQLGVGEGAVQSIPKVCGGEDQHRWGRGETIPGRSKPTSGHHQSEGEEISGRGRMGVKSY